MADRDFRRRLRRLVRCKVQEIVDGCLFCQGKAQEESGINGCTEHASLINDIVLHPKKYRDELMRAGVPEKKT